MSPLLGWLKDKALDLKDRIDEDATKRKIDNEKIKAYEKEFEKEDHEKYLKEKARIRAKKKMDRKMRSLR